MGSILHMLTPQTRHVSPSSLTTRPSSPRAPLLDLPDRHIDLVNTVHSSCTVALVDDPRCQPPTVSYLASLIPQSKPQYPFFTALSPSTWTRLTFTFAISELHTCAPEAKKHVAQPKLTPRLVQQLNPKRYSHWQSLITSRTTWVHIDHVFTISPMMSAMSTPMHNSWVKEKEEEEEEIENSPKWPKANEKPQ
jgi:hypothetical protein